MTQMQLLQLHERFPSSLTSSSRVRLTTITAELFWIATRPGLSYAHVGLEQDLRASCCSSNSDANHASHAREWHGALKQ
jgi:hypothetical protein